MSLSVGPGSNDGKNQKSKISLNCPFNLTILVALLSNFSTTGFCSTLAPSVDLPSTAWTSWSSPCPSSPSLAAPASASSRSFESSVCSVLLGPSTGDARIRLRIFKVLDTDLDPDPDLVPDPSHVIYCKHICKSLEKTYQSKRRIYQLCAQSYRTTICILYSIVYRPKIINTILMYQLLYSCWIRIREKVQDTTGSGSTSLGETIIVPIKYSKNVLNVASFFLEPKV